LGFDIFIDHKLKPWLIEVNQSPSFATDSPLDYRIKKQVIGDSFNLLNMSYEKRSELIINKKMEMEKRILTGKSIKLGGEEREKLRQEKMAERDIFEKDRLGGYTMIFPCKNETRNKEYESFIKKANDLWDDFTTGKQKKAPQIEKKGA
jgi:tubulin polyglutamylase TTLL6/13